MRSSTKTDKTSEFTLLNVDSEMYLQSLPASISISVKLNAIKWKVINVQYCRRAIQIC